MTPDQVKRAKLLIDTRRFLLRVRSELIAHPSSWVEIVAGKPNEIEHRIDEGKNVIMPGDLGREGIDLTIAKIDIELADLGVKEENDNAKPKDH